MAKDTNGNVSFRAFSWFNTSLIGLIVIIGAGGWSTMRADLARVERAASEDLARVEGAWIAGLGKLETHIDDLGKQITNYTESTARATANLDKRLAIQELKQ